MPIKLKNINHSSNFTVIELIVVITIIAILSGVVIAASTPLRQQARDNQRKADLAAYQSALQQYYSENKQYPDPTPDPCCASQCLESFLGAELSPLPQDPLSPDCSGNYGYYYTSQDGQNYKLYTKLENDTKAMANDGGTDPLAYEVYSTLGNQLAISFYLGGITENLRCSIMSVADCASQSGVNVLRLSADTNAHAEAPAQTNYDTCVCCFGPTGLGTDCNATNKSIFLKLSASTNAHAEKNTQSNYSNSVCISTSTKSSICAYREENCQAGETTLCSISGDTNAHIGSPDTYNIKVCCKTG